MENAALHDCTYHGARRGLTAEVWVGTGSRRFPLPMRNNLRNHSPAGPEWGYGGSGPAQLALALLCHATGDDRRALAAYQRYKFRVVGGLHHVGWTLTRREVLAVLEQIEQEELADLGVEPQAPKPSEDDMDKRR